MRMIIDFKDLKKSFLAPPPKFQEESSLRTVDCLIYKTSISKHPTIKRYTNIYSLQSTGDGTYSNFFGMGWGRTVTMEWSLHPEVFARITSVWDTPHLDLFATINYVYVILVPDPMALQVNALSMD